MNATEVSDLLAFAALYDNRKAAEPDIMAWLRAIGDLPYADSEAAVAAHYGETPERIMPGHIRIRVKAMRAERLARAILPPPPDDMADHPVKGKYAKAILAGIERIADGTKLPPEITGPLPGEPPTEWQQSRDAMRRAGVVKPDPRQIAREQVEELRQARRDRGETA